MTNNNIKLFIILPLLWLFGLQHIAAQTSKDTASGHYTEAQVIGVCKQVSEDGHAKSVFSLDGYSRLPTGVVRNIGGKDYVVAFVKNRVRRNKGKINAFFTFPFPGSNIQLAFMAEGLNVSPGSVNMVDGAILRMVSNLEIPFGDKAKLVLKNDGKNFIEIGCNGFRRVHLSGDVVFDRGFIQSADSSVKTVTTSFEVEASDPANIIAQITLKNFKLSALPELTFSVEQATLDFSEKANAPGMVLPAGYTLGFGGAPELWQGFYLKNAKVTLPNFLSCNKSKPIIINAGNLIIDKTGLSCAVNVSGLSGDSCASASSWPITVNSFQFSMLRNSLREFGFSGNLKISELKDEKFSYTASVSLINSKPEYLFVLGIDNEKTYELPLLSSTLKLSKNSSISIQYKDGELVPTAMLNGELTINQKPLDTKLRFEGLMLTTKSPYIDFKVIANDDTYSQGIGGFNLSLSKIEIRKPNPENLSVGFNAAVSLTSDYSGAVSMAVFAKRNGTSHRWEFDKLVIDSIGINAKTSAIALAGSLVIRRDDPVYGNGFAGSVKMSVTGIISDISATAMFGKVDGFNYWYADASVTLPRGIPCGFISFYGFRGGAYQCMKQQNVEKTSVKGAAYIPDKATAFGLKAGVTLGLSNQNTFNADVLLEIAFNTKGGINRVIFTGDAYFMKSIAERKGMTPSQLPLYAGINIDYNRVTKEFLASVDAYVNIGNGLIRGVNPGNFAGRCEFFFGPSEWYVHLGRPDVPLGITMLNMMRTSGYFMAGKLVGLPPPLPPQLSRLSSKLKPMNWNDIKEGKGVATGAQISVSAGGELGIFYASLAVGGGFDVVLNNFGSKAHCEGSTGTLGINGWYAMGQAYVWLEGNVGVQVKIRKKNRKFDVLSLGAAALLQAELPNPLWMQGGITGSYRVLGGLVKGSIDYTFEIGHKCEIVRGNPNLADIEVIGDISPGNASTNIDVFTTPQVVFNMPVNRSMSVEDRDYKIIMDEFTVTGAGQNLTGNFVWNEDGNVVVLKRDKILPPETDITVKTKIHWQEKSGDNWTDAKDDAGIITESKSVTFHSGKAPNYIPENNVTYCYPKQKMVNFYKLEYPSGYVKLNVDQDYLFKTTDPDGKKWNLKAVFVEGNNQYQSDFTYDYSRYEVSFAIPAGLNINKKYKLYLKKVPQVTAVIDANVKATETSTAETGGGDLTLTTKKAEGAIAVGEEVVVYEIDFRTSQYETFMKKWQKAEFIGNFLSSNGVGNIQNLRYRLDETFEDGEVIYEIGTESTWYQSFIYPVIYKNYPYGGLVSFPDTYGIPPLRAIRPQLIGATSPTFESCIYPSLHSIYLYWDFTTVTWDDFYRAKDVAYSLYLKGKSIPSSLSTILNTLYEFRVSGKFNVYVRYTLPGKKVINGAEFTLPFNL